MIISNRMKMNGLFLKLNMSSVKAVTALCLDNVKIKGYWSVNPASFPMMRYISSDDAKAPGFDMWGVPLFAIPVPKANVPK